MRIITGTLFSLMFLSFSVNAQKKGATGGGGAGAPAASSGPSSATGSQQTGYVYRLPWHYHLHYSSVHKRVADSLVVGGVAAGNFDQQKIRTVHRRVPMGIGGTEEIYQAHKKLPAGLFVDKDSLSPETPSGNELRGKTITFTEIDSVSRYWEKPSLGIRHWYYPWNWAKYLYHFRQWPTRYRLRTAITQADSGKLQVGIYERDFPPSLHPYPEARIDRTMIVRGKSQTINDALPIGQSDSAQNFYLQIDNKIRVADPISYISLRYGLTQYGAMVIPYKYRFAPKHTSIYVPKPMATRYNADTVVSAPSESTGNINLAVYLGRKWGYTRFYFDPSKTHNTLAGMISVFGGASLVPLNVSNVRYPKDTDSLPSQTIAFTWGGAASLEWRGIDLGIFVGQDMTSNKYGWIYNKKWWVGFGIGVNLGMFTAGPSQIQL